MGIGVERSCFSLRNFLDFAEQFGCGGLIDSGFLCQTADTYGFQNTENAECINIAAVFRNIERYLNMRLRSEIVNLIRLNHADNPDQ